MDATPQLSPRGARPRILYFVTEDWFFHSHFLGLARAARDAGFDVAVATRPGRHWPALEAEGFALHALSLRRRSLDPVQLGRAVATLARIMRRVAPDIVHNVALKPILVGSAAARLAGCGRVVNAVTGLGHLFIDEGRATRAVRGAVSLALRAALSPSGTTTVAENADDERLIAGIAPAAAARITIVPGAGVDLAYFHALPEPPEPVIVACAARMLESKGIGVLVAAIRALRGRGENIRLVLAGTPDPGNPASIPETRLRAWNAEEGIEWRGHVEDVREVWARAHVAVLASEREGLPKALIEAAACGRPMVATDVPGCRAIVRNGETGLLVPPGNVMALAEALSTLAGDSVLRARLGAGARALVEAEMGAERINALYLGLYAHALTRP